MVDLNFVPSLPKGLAHFLCEGPHTEQRSLWMLNPRQRLEPPHLNDNDVPEIPGACAHASLNFAKNSSARNLIHLFCDQLCALLVESRKIRRPLLVVKGFKHMACCVGDYLVTVEPKLEHMRDELTTKLIRQSTITRTQLVPRAQLNSLGCFFKCCDKFAFGDALVNGKASLRHESIGDLPGNLRGDSGELLHEVCLSCHVVVAES
eukprot:CAMPEP_0172871494 /NCGR_PEP_ID=MMETSP1075-20121228/92116_1 /TAXON_ID=2916 /ORGANISM="Ceratium fusus, Strain PA161109" /LENGTH=205 /DNA_ID=CAMNT_0013721745 /DNA_START=180 /DNA_END=797 /DNA_ORIENTATION=-